MLLPRYVKEAVTLSQEDLEKYIEEAIEETDKETDNFDTLQLVTIPFKRSTVRGVIRLKNPKREVVEILLFESLQKAEKAFCDYAKLKGITEVESISTGFTTSMQYRIR